MGTSDNKEISCRVTRTLLMYVRECNGGTLGNLLDDLKLDEHYLLDPDNWVSHAFLQVLYHRMIRILDDKNAVYHMTIASERFQSLGLLDRIVRLLGSPKLIYGQAPKYNRLLKLNGDVYIHELEKSWVVLEDRYHDSAQKTRFDCDYTRGILAGIPTLFGMPPAEIEEVECQVHPDVYGERMWPDHPAYGRPGCLYRVRWQKSKAESVRKRFITNRRVFERAIEDLQEANLRIQEKYDEARRLAVDLETANRDLLASKRQLEQSRAEYMVSERRYRLLAENASDIIWTFNLATMRFDYISPSVLRVRGFSPEEAMEISLEATLSPQSFQLVRKTLAEELARDSKEGIDPNRSRTMELEQVCKDGSFAWSEATVTFIRNEEGEPVGVLGSTRDINERKWVEHERAQLEAMLTEARRLESLGTLAGGIAHDFNNLLMGVQGHASVMSMKLDPGHPFLEHVKGIEECVNSAAELTHRLLGFARSGKYELKATDINRLTERTSEMFGRTRKEISIVRKLQPDVRPVEVDRSQMEQVLLNLFVNAWQAMPGGGVLTLETQNVMLGQKFAEANGLDPGLHVKILVTDTGAGMDEETRRRVFEPFFTTKDIKRGTGLGLASSYGIIGNHGGIITVSSIRGQGSTFTIYLPAVCESPDPEKEPIVRAILKGKETVLLVDDEEKLRDVGAQMIQLLGYTVLTAGSAKEAIAVFKDNKDRVALIILDMIMPEMGGDEAFDRLVSIHPDIKVILASGYSVEGKAGDVLKRGCSGFIQKPFSLEELSQKMRDVLDG
ncbi:MAG: response regulator [Desulfobacterales bacterium]